MTRRMILALRVFGRSRTNLTASGRSGLPSCWATILVDHVGGHAGDRAGEAARLQWADREAADDPAGDLGPAGVVDDWAAAAPDLLEEPAPRLRVPRLAGRAEHPQRGEIVLADRLFAEPHQAADGRWRDAEHGDAVALDHRPDPVRAGVVRGALVAEGGR